LREAEEDLARFQRMERPAPISIQKIIARAELEVSPELEASEEDVQRWDEILRKIFQEQTSIEEFHQIFSVSYLLRNEEKLYQEILESRKEK